jgi:hypothetical protein
LLPVAIVALVAAHVLLVRRHGIVPPFALEERKRILAAAASDGAASDGAATDGAPAKPATEPVTGPAGESTTGRAGEAPAEPMTGRGPAGEAEPTG